MTSLSDFFGETSKTECCYCGRSDGQLEADLSILDDVTGEPVYMQHAECAAKAAERREAQRKAKAERDAAWNHMAATMD